MVRYTLSSFMLCVNMKSMVGVKIAISTRSFKIFIYFLKLRMNFCLNMSKNQETEGMERDSGLEPL